MRPRANQAHVPFQDIPQLRQLVEAVLAQKAAEPRDARIIGHLEKGTSARMEMENLVAQPVCAMNHCPKLVTGKEHAPFTDAQRRINRRALRLESHSHSDHKHQRPEQENSDRGEQEIQNPFGKSAERRNGSPGATRNCSRLLRDRRMLVPQNDEEWAAGALRQSTR